LTDVKYTQMGDRLLENTGQPMRPPPPDPNQRHMSPDHHSASQIYPRPPVSRARTALWVLLPVALVILGWFVLSALTPEPVHTESTGSINYSGQAEVMDIGETQTKCFVYIRRDTGQETKQKMAKDACRKFRVGDLINIENGQYVSTANSS
jgi:hypothetical protein